MNSRLLHLFLCAAVAVPTRGRAETTTPEQRQEVTSVTYGLDVSFPVHHRVSTNYDVVPFENNAVPPETDEPLQVLGNRQEMYVNHLNGCREQLASTEDSDACDSYEYDRMLMNLRQPQSMVNMTEIGFQKVRAPEHLIKLVEKFWQANHKIQTEDRTSLIQPY